MKRWIPRSLYDDGMIGGDDIPPYALDVKPYVLLSDHEQAMAEKDQEIARWKNTIRDEYVGFLAESKENLLQQYVNLTQMYGEQKHEIRRLLATIAEKDREIEALKKRVQRAPEEWESVCGECDGSGWR